MMSFLYVFIGGGLGSLCRYGIAQIWAASLFPYGTLMANILSSLILGILIGYNLNNLMDSQYKLLLMTGFCGGFSTFSTFSGEIVSLYQSGQIMVSMTYLVVSIMAGLLSILLGMFLTRCFIS